MWNRLGLDSLGTKEMIGGLIVTAGWLVMAQVTSIDTQEFWLMGIFFGVIVIGFRLDR